ncbi:cytochrome P450 67 [Coprinellus micaceus]|uniref:Cytochrome P450 67 n=1 Tax=Coprinellus micaceus TaxID=71717 RepID=A0A4Y7T9Z5_COPMI|nr:cytochrome P450 67 [Coprinellus micaceus]
MPSMAQVLFADAVLAVGSHYLWFRKYEPTSYRVISAVILLLTSPVTYTLLNVTGNAPTAIALGVGTFMAALFTSIIVYRLSPWHPLSSCPGPLICKVTKMWTAYLAWTGKTHLYYLGLHEKYGRIVRIGPNDISVTDKALFPHILGAQGMPKGPVWENRRIVTARDSRGHRSLHAVRDLKLHGELRKPWNKAFGKEPLKDYEIALVKNAAILVEQLQDVCRDGEEVLIDGAQWLSYFSFDFMGDMVFGKSQKFLTEGDPNGVWDVMQESLVFRTVAQHIPWIRPLVPFLPSSFLRADTAFRKFAASQAKARAQSEPLSRDLFYHLISNTEVEPGTSVLPLIMADAVLAIFGGSDTSATTFSNVLYYLVRYPEWQMKVRKEVDDALRFVAERNGSSAFPDLDELAEWGVLNAVINETLRLQPGAPTLLQRGPAPGSGGKQLGNIFLPEGTTVQVPPYAVHRDSRYFYPRTKDFWPERWFRGPEAEGGCVLDRSVFIPFSMGPANCVGKPLALKQLRYVVAVLVHNFEFRFPEGYDAADWESEMKDRFLMVKGELPVLINISQGP